MSVIKREPVAVATGVSAGFAIVLEWLVGYYIPAMPPPVRYALVGVISFVVARVARKYSFSEDTIREANLDPARVRARAANPLVDRCTVGEEPAP